MGNINSMTANIMKYYCIYDITTIIGVIILILILVWLLVFKGGFGVNNSDLIFNLHPFLMTLGMVLMFSHAILCYRTGRNNDRNCMKCCHGIFLFLTIVISIFGILAAFSSHIMKNIPNMYTLHSWIGMIAIVLLIFNFCLAYSTIACSAVEPDFREICCRFHKKIGIACFLIAIIAAIIGVSQNAIFGIENYKDLPIEGAICNIIGVLLLLYGILILHLVLEDSYRREEKKACPLPCTPCRPPPPPKHYYYPRQVNKLEGNTP